MRPFATACFVTSLIASTRVAHAQDAATVAHQRFLDGMRRYDAHRYADALEEFRASYGLFASPNSRLYIARSLRDEGRLADAATEYETTQREAEARAESDPRYLATRDAARDELLAIDPRIGRLTLSIPNAPRWVRVRVNGRVTPRGELGIAIPIAPGTVDILVDADGYPTEHRALTVAAGERAQLGIMLQGPAIPPANPPSHARASGRRVLDGEWMLHGRGIARPLAYTALGLGVAGFIGFAAFGASANGTYADLSQRCTPPPCGPGLRASVDTGRTVGVLANVSLGVGIGGLVAGAALLVLGPRFEPAPGTQLSFGPGSLTVRSTF